LVKKTLKKVGIDPHYNIINKVSPHHEFNSVISLDVSEHIFSTIATEFIQHRKILTLLLLILKNPGGFMINFKILFPIQKQNMIG